MSETLRMTIEPPIAERESLADKPKAGQLLAHLSAAQVEELYGRYLAGESCAALVAEFKVNCPANSLIKAFPPLIREDLPCPYCSAPMSEARKTRSGGGGMVSCAPCKHSHRRSGDVYRYCSCRGCRRANEKQQEERRQAQTQAALEWVEACNQLGPPKITFSDLTPAARFLCFTLAMTATERRGQHAFHLERWSSSTQLANAYLVQLMQAGAVKISYQGLYLQSVETARSTRSIWRLPLELTICRPSGEMLSPANVITEFLGALNGDISGWAPAICDITQTERAYDVLEYMALILADERVPFRDEQSMAQTLSVVLRYQRYPMSLLYAAAWRTAMGIGRGLRNGKLTCVKHANNATHGALERMLGGEDFTTGAAKRFNRDARLPQSVILNAVEKYLIGQHDVVFRLSDQDLHTLLMKGLAEPGLPY